MKSSNITRNNPDLPGYDTSSSGMWYNHIEHVNYPNIGSKSFMDTIANYISFDCDPQNNSGGGGWFSGVTGTKYVRYWLR